MAELSRYNAGGDEIETPEGILKNKLDIKNPDDLGDAETILYKDATKYFDELLLREKITFNLSLLFEIHSYFFKTLYSWAGKPRTVNMSKGNTFFIPVAYLPNALRELDHIIQKNIPTEKDTKKIVAQKIVTIHCEFNAIHPFREGNGRTIRLFLDLLVRNIGWDRIQYELSSDESYITACIDGMKLNYKKMETLIYKGLKKKK